MSSYTFFILLAIAACLPLLVTGLSTRLWHDRQRYFTWFLFAVILCNISELLRSSGIVQQYDTPFGALSIVLSLWVAVQFYSFISSVFSSERKAWLLPAYGSVAVMAILVVLRQIDPQGSHIPWYDRGTILMTFPILALLQHSRYAIRKKLRSTNNIIPHNMVFTLNVSILVISATTLAGVFLQYQWLPIVQAGYIIVALMFSYALTEHRQFQIRPLLQRGMAWTSLGVAGAGCYWVLFMVVSSIFKFNITYWTAVLATIVAIIVAVAVYNLRNLIPVIANRAFRRPKPDFYRKLNDFTDKIDGKASLRQQADELLSLVIEAIDCTKAALLFLNLSETDYITMYSGPEGPGNDLSGFSISNHSPLTESITTGRKVFTRENMAALPELRTAWKQEVDDIKSRDIEFLVPLLSRNNLTGILVIGKKQSGDYTIEDSMLLKYLTDRLAVVMEKGFFSEQRRQYEEELSVINRSSVIISSSLDIGSTYNSLIDELRRMVDISWSAISLIDKDEINFLAVYSAFRSSWQAGDRLPLQDTPANWLQIHKETVVESDTKAKSRFAGNKYLLRQGFRSAVHIPLITGEDVIGSLEMASRIPDAFDSRHINILERVAAQIAIQVENSRLYGEAMRMAHIDDLTGLHNRRAMNEMITREIDHCSRYGGLFSLIIIDIDSLKSINDSYGHLAGDEFIKKVGNNLKTSIRNTDRAFRYGGDEFAIILPQTPVSAAEEIAERVRRHLAASTIDRDTRTTVSLGVAGWVDNSSDAESIMAAADAALYQAKKRGGNRSCRAAEAVKITG